jgi:transcriptional regulator with XRE-family HTH domain
MQHRTLRDVSAAARVSLGYLSEVERGQKEASSELLAAICEALDVRLSDLLREVSDGLAAVEQPARVPVPARKQAALAGVGAALSVRAARPGSAMPSSAVPAAKAAAVAARTARESVHDTREPAVAAAGSAPVVHRAA